MNNLFNLKNKLSFIIAMVLLIGTSHPSMTMAQRYKPINSRPQELVSNCAELQAIFNELSWEKDTNFAGFSNKRLSTSTDYFTAQVENSCSGGHITEESPLGKRICAGEIKQIWWEEYKYKWNIGFRRSNSSNEHCRWKK
jgi:hypothetical protein